MGLRMNTPPPTPDPIHPWLARLRPDLVQRPGHERIGGMLDTLTAIYTAPLAIAGTIWLVVVTDLERLQAHWVILTACLACMVIFSRLNYIFIINIQDRGYANATGELDSAFLWVALFLAGPGALWLAVVFSVAEVLLTLRGPLNRGRIWFVARNLFAIQATNTLSYLAALQLVGKIERPFLNDFSSTAILTALAAIAAQFVFQQFIWSGFIAGSIIAVRRQFHTSGWEMARFNFLAFGLPTLANPFSILLAGLYVQFGVWAPVLLIGGMMMVALLARQLGRAAEDGRQQALQMQQLERLGRAMLTTPPADWADPATLPGLLREHVPQMFTFGRETIWLAPDQTLLQPEKPTSTMPQAAWAWARENPESRAFLAKQILPWGGKMPAQSALLFAPILDTATRQPIGMVLVELSGQLVRWYKSNTISLLPGVNTLASQVASALHQASLYRDALAYERTQKELDLARRIQDSFLPDELPSLPGWELAATLEPARHVAGDYYDVIPLPGGRLGLLIADVADKGVGPSLYMALSRTLIRTYAMLLPDDPLQVLATANQRVIADARASLFVTVFFAVLDPQNGTLTYCNAGHNPPYLHHADHRPPDLLGNPGRPLGVEIDARLSQHTLTIQEGDILILYTDGVTDAQNAAGEFLGVAPLQRQANWEGKSAQEILADIVHNIQHFVGDTPQFDDVTLMVLARQR